MLFAGMGLGAWYSTGRCKEAVKVESVYLGVGREKVLEAALRGLKMFRAHAGVLLRRFLFSFFSISCHS
jgi:hypothetical protein